MTHNYIALINREGKRYQHTQRYVRAEKGTIKDARHVAICLGYNVIVPKGYDEQSSKGYIVVDESKNVFWMPQDKFWQNFGDADSVENRVLLELLDIRRRINDLYAYIFKDGHNDPYEQLIEQIGAEQATLLRMQLFAMTQYYDILKLRAEEMDISLRHIDIDLDCDD